jgi:serine/threonine protein kinase
MMDMITKSPPEPLTRAMHPSYSAELCDFINGMLQLDPAARYTCDQLVAHPYLLGPTAPLDDDNALFAAYERRIPQTAHPNHGSEDAVLWAVGATNLADLDLILERLVKQHLVPELAAAIRAPVLTAVDDAFVHTPAASSSSASASATGASPAASSPGFLSSPGSLSNHDGSPDDTTGEMTFNEQRSPIASASDAAFTTSMHHALHVSTTSPAESGGVIETVPVIGIAHSLVGSASAIPADFASPSSALSSPTLHPVVLPSVEFSSSNEDESSSSPPQPTHCHPFIRTRTASYSNGNDDQDGPPVEATATASAGTTIEAAPLAPHDVAPINAMGDSVAAGSLLQLNDDSPNDSSMEAPLVGPRGLSLHISAQESVELASSPAIEAPTPVVRVEGTDSALGLSLTLTASDVDSATPINVFDSIPVPVRPRLGLSLGAQSSVDDEESIIPTFSVDESTCNNSSVNAAEDALAAVVSPLNGLVNVSPLEVAGLELLHMDADRCECLARQFALTPEDVQARFLAKQRELLMARRLVPGVSTPY